VQREGLILAESRNECRLIATPIMFRFAVVNGKSKTGKPIVAENEEIASDFAGFR
jgi:hypothetical protein